MIGHKKDEDENNRYQLSSFLLKLDVVSCRQLTVPAERSIINQETNEEEVGVENMPKFVEGRCF